MLRAFAAIDCVCAPVERQSLAVSAAPSVTFLGIQTLYRVFKLSVRLSAAMEDLNGQEFHRVILVEIAVGNKVVVDSLFLFDKFIGVIS